ncbi:uncharacterized protein G2W53_024808 [Senna tora]|uniref:Transmembrane protein n=1 Tax=Senna tora TaxID=362788 RepID=A0A834TC73_9FABA|nr:uncharacterized protein G2W53_024808 [Senna tora]
MATISQFSVLVFLLVFFANSQVLITSTTHHSTISASPAVSPYVTAPNISSFFPTPRGVGGPESFAASPEAEASSPSSGEFVGKRTSSSARLDCAAAAIVGILLISSFLITCRVV